MTNISAPDYSDIFLARIREIENCLEAQSYLAALTLSLTLPDICGKAEYPNAKVGERYMQWYDQYVGAFEKSDSPYSADMPYLSGEVVYNLRNSFLHSGNPNIIRDKVKEARCQIDQFELVMDDSLLGDTSCVSYSAGMQIRERRYKVNVRLLCMKLCRTAKGYYLQNKEKFDFFEYSIVAR